MVSLLGCWCSDRRARSARVAPRVLPDARRLQRTRVLVAPAEALDGQRREVGLALAVGDEVGERATRRGREAEAADAAARGDVEPLETRYAPEDRPAVGRHRGRATTVQRDTRGGEHREVLRDLVDQRAEHANVELELGDVEAGRQGGGIDHARAILVAAEQEPALLVADVDAGLE